LTKQVPASPMVNTIAKSFVCMNQSLMRRSRHWKAQKTKGKSERSKQRSAQSEIVREHEQSPVEKIFLPNGEADKRLGLVNRALFVLLATLVAASALAAPEVIFVSPFECLTHRILFP
jgi:hypothetical protein